jgi:ribosomal protein S18 acetylase RimI-like enzyme
MDTTATAQISQAGPGDWAALRQVRLAALAEAPYAFSSTLDQEKGKTEDQWRARVQKYPNFLAWQGGEPVGLAGGFAELPDGQPQDGRPPVDQPGEPGAAGSRGWHLVSMWVSPQARGSGVAGQLVQAVCAAARADGATRVRLWVTDSNPRAQAFYQRMGFHRTGARQVVRPEEPDHWEEERELDLAGVSGPAA